MVHSVPSPGQRVTEIHCNRASVLLSSFNKYQRKKKARKIQKDVLRVNAGITPPAYEVASVYTSPVAPSNNNIGFLKSQRADQSSDKVVLFDVCNCENKADMTKEKYSPNTWESITKMYKDIDTTQIWIEPNDLKTKKEHIGKRKNKKGENFAKENVGQVKDSRNKRRKDHKNKSKAHKKQNNHNDKKHPSSKRKDKQGNEILNKPYDDTNRDSVVSLFRHINKNRKSPKAKLKFEKNPKSGVQNRNDMCKCDKHDYDNKLNTFELHCYNEDCQFRNKSQKRKEMKYKSRAEKVLFNTPDRNLIEKNCVDGPCVEAVRHKNKNFLCKCIKRKKEPEFTAKECTNTTCKIPTKSLSANSVEKMKEKILCLCHKYSQKIVNMKNHYPICKGGLCLEALKHNKHDFICKCNKERSIKACSDDTCGKYTKTKTEVPNNGHGDHTLPKEKKTIKSPETALFKCFSTKSGLLKYMFSKKKNDETFLKLEHASEQTGEPFFEVKVNPFDMCVLNPTEIKKNVLKYGKKEINKLDCNCSSRTHLRPEEVCKRGVCNRALRNKQTNFNCKCEKKFAECEDSTCGINFKGDHLKVANNRKNLHNPKSAAQDKPLFEVQLDKDKMCVLNSQEIQNKILNNQTVDEICSSGICREAALRHNIPFFCKCIGRKMNPDTTECSEETCTENRKSKFSIFCSRICSKSENWTSRNSNRRQKRVTRRSYYDIGPHKLCRGKICTKSDNFQNRVDVNSDQYINHLPSCHCQECKDNIKSRNKSRARENSNFNKKKKEPIENNEIKRPRETAKTHSNLNKKKDLQQNSYLENDEKKELRESVKDARLNKRRKKRIRHPRKIKKDHTKEEEIQIENIVCTCAHACECNIDDMKSEGKKLKDKEKLDRKKRKQKLKNKKIDQRNFTRDQKRRAKLDKIKEKRATKERLKEIRMMQKKMKEEPLDTNCFMAFILGILKTALKAALFILAIIIAIITDPKGSFWYVRDRIMDPKGTYSKIVKWLGDAIFLKKLQITETIRGSDTLTILADHFQDSTFYQSVVDKGRTKADQVLFEQKSKARKRRIRKRQEQAIFSCRHMLLTTLRQTPCLWVYHICPNFYPQCLSLLSFMRSFSHILLFLAAFACWTPCIVCIELCRAIMCCFMCTN